MSVSHTREQARVLEGDLFYLVRAADADTRAPLLLRRKITNSPYRRQR